jgi:hypothetical protein
MRPTPPLVLSEEVSGYGGSAGLLYEAHATIGAFPGGVYVDVGP